MSALFSDGPEYVARCKRSFSPTKVTLREIHAVVPEDLRQKSTMKALVYVGRHALFCGLSFLLASHIDAATLSFGTPNIHPSAAIGLANWLLWCVYWCFQSLIFSGFFTLGHEAGHGSLSSRRWVNEAIGFILHTVILVPYHAWRSSHHAHHKATMSLERDQHYIPRTRSSLGLPEERIAKRIDYLEILEETPISTLFRLIMMQVFGWPAYLLYNEGGNPRYNNQLTNHFLPSSPLFKPSDKNNIIASDIGLISMAYLLRWWATAIGRNAFIKLYLIPYVISNHWLIMFTYLQHVDPTVPIYRGREWTFVRGALSTVDRPFLGWVGRLFLHNASHDHVAHHLFSSIPFYNLPAVTQRIKTVLKEDYNYDSTNSFRALYRTFRDCCFIEDEGDIVFYRNRQGDPVRFLKKE